jgi:uncharacterized membrane protein YbaN (DUF454 family)
VPGLFVGYAAPVRIVYLVVGLLCVGLGAIGVVLPVVPTTPFLIVALAMFAKSSARLERWLLEHKKFGPRLRAWRAHRVIPLPVKLTAWGSMVASLGLMALTGRWYAVASAAVVMAIGAIYVARCPSKIPAEDGSAMLPPHGADGSVRKQAGD